MPRYCVVLQTLPGKAEDVEGKVRASGDFRGVWAVTGSPQVVGWGVGSMSQAVAAVVRARAVDGVTGSTLLPEPSGGLL